MAKEKAEVVGVVREWNPQHDTSLTSIHAQIDAWGRRQGERPVRDHAEVEAAVDKLTKRVKTRKVVVHETVTEYVPAEESEAPAPGSNEQASRPTEGEAPKKKGFSWFRRKAKQGEPAAQPSPTAPEPMSPPPAAIANEAAASDAWDPGQGRAIEPVKPLQSKAAKRNAAKAKSGKGKKGKKR